MANKSEDLWPADLTNEPTARAPLLILREQAAKLGEKTANIVEAKVAAEPAPDGSQLLLRFSLVAPALGGYEYVLFRVVQPVDLYPATLQTEEGTYVADEEKSFKLCLEGLFRSARTRRIVSGLLAQSKSA